MRDFIAGMTAWLNGWKTILSRRQLIVVAMIPFMISFFAAVGCIWLIWVYSGVVMASLTTGFMSGLPTWLYNFLYYPMLWALGLVLVAGSLYVVYVLHAIVATPFYSLLAERTLQLHGKGAAEVTSWREWSRQMVTMLRISLVKGLFLALIGVCIFVASFIPIVNIFAVMGTMLLLAFDCLDYSLEARRLRLRQRVRYALRNKAQWAGLAFGLALTLLLPGLTLLVIPGAVTGAAMILKDTDESRVTTPKNS